MGRENVVHLHNGVLHGSKNNGILKSSGKWMDLETKHIECGNPDPERQI